MNEVERAYHDGMVDAKLAAHDEHLNKINGSIDRSNTILESLGRAVDKMGDQVTGILLVMPKIQTTAEEALTAERVAKTLKQKQLEDQTRWERWRTTVAWAVGMVVTLATLGNFLALHH